MRQRRLLSAIAAVTLLAAAAAGCGDDDDGTENTTATTEESTAPRPTGTPYKLVVGVENNPAVGSSYPQVAGGAEAAAKAINDAGGIDGHPVEIVECDTGANANGAARCARDAVADPQVLAMVGNFTSFGASVNPVLEEAKMASIANFAIDLKDFSSPSSFPMMGGSITAVAGMATLITDALDGKKLNTAFLDIPSGQLVVGLVEQVLKTRPGATLAEKAPVPSNSADLSAPVAASGRGDPDGIILTLTTQDATKFIQAARQQGVDAPLVASGASLNDQAVADLGGAADGVYVTAVYLPVSSGGDGNAKFVREMDALDEDLPKDDLAKNSWLGVHLFAHVAESLATVERASVLEGLGKVTAYDTGGITPEIDFTKTFDGLGGALPRIVNHTVVYAQVKDGAITALDDQFVDPFAAPSGG